MLALLRLSHDRCYYKIAMICQNIIHLPSDDRVGRAKKIFCGQMSEREKPCKGFEMSEKAQRVGYMGED